MVSPASVEVTSWRSAPLSRGPMSWKRQPTRPVWASTLRTCIFTGSVKPIGSALITSVPGQGLARLRRVARQLEGAAAGRHVEQLGAQALAAKVEVDEAGQAHAHVLALGLRFVDDGRRLGR
jgi:hypothetical protein